MSHDVFVCHSSQDRTIANAIVARLEERGIRCWVAPRDVVPGVEYAQSIIEAIGGSRLTILVFSAHANASPHVRRELERTASHGIPILPFRVEDVVPAPSVEYFISDAHWLDAMTPPVEQHLEHLAGTVRLLLDRQSAALGTAAVGTDTQGPSQVADGEPAAPRRRWLVPVAVAAAALVVVAVVVGVVLTLAGGGDDPMAQADGLADPSPAAEAELEFAGNFTDGFDVALRGGWMWDNEDRDGWRIEDSRLEIDAVQGPSISNVLVRELPDAPLSVLTTLVRFQPAVDYQFAGIVLTGTDPDNDRIQFGRAFCGNPECVGDGLYLDVVEGGALVPAAPGVPLEGTGIIYLGLEVYEDEVIATYSYDGDEIWDVAASAPLDGRYTRVGLIAHQAPVPITAAFDHVSLDEYRWESGGSS